MNEASEEVGGEPLASPGSPVSRILVGSVPIPGTDLENRVYEITLAPGCAVPAHTHPVAGVGYIVAGHGVSRYQGQDAVELAPGGTFIDHADLLHETFANRSATEPLVFVVSYAVERNGAVIRLS